MSVNGFISFWTFSNSFNPFGVKAIILFSYFSNFFFSKPSIFLYKALFCLLITLDFSINSIKAILDVLIRTGFSIKDWFKEI